MSSTLETRMQTLEQAAELAGATLAMAGGAGAREGASTVAGVPAMPVRGAAIDSRTLLPGEVFVALPGGRADGHEFVAQALEHGAPAALVRRDWWAGHAGALPPGSPALVCEDVLLSLQRWATGWRAAHAIPVGAVTGSNGKTTTRAMLARILESRGPALASRGNLNNHIGVPLTLLRLGEEHWAAGIEMGMSARGEIARLCEIAAPTAGAITNAGKAHLEQLGTLEEVGRAKSELAEYLERTGGTAAINADDPVLVRLNRGRRCITFGIEAQADLRAAHIELQGLSGSRFQVLGGPRVQLGLPGRHNILNALAAMALARAMGVDLAAAAAALHGFSGGERGRLEVRRVGGVTLLDDTYNANPLSLGAALQLLRLDSTPGRRTAALGDMLELGPGAAREHEEAGRLLGGIDTLYAVGNFSEDLARGARDAGVAHVLLFPDSASAAPVVAAGARTGDVILVKGSRGIRMERVVEALQGALGGTGR